MKKLLLIALLSISFSINALLMTKAIVMNQKDTYHTLQSPMIFESEAAEDKYYLLPAGTTLYFDKAFPEGHVRYITYINYKGPPLDTKKSEKEGFIAPSWIHKIDKNELKILLNKYPLSKNDIKGILKSNSFTRAELIEIINSFKE